MANLDKWYELVVKDLDVWLYGLVNHQWQFWELDNCLDCQELLQNWKVREQIFDLRLRFQAGIHAFRPCRLRLRSYEFISDGHIAIKLIGFLSVSQIQLSDLTSNNISHLILRLIRVLNLRVPLPSDPPLCLMVGLLPLVVLMYISNQIFDDFVVYLSVLLFQLWNILGHVFQTNVHLVDNVLRVYTHVFFLQDVQHLKTYNETAAVALVADRKLRDLPGDHIYRVLVDIRVWVLR